MSILIQLSAAKMRLSVQTSHLYRTFIQNLYRRVGRPAENVLNMEYLIWRTEILSDEGLYSFAKTCPPMEREGEILYCSSMCFNMFRLQWDENGQVVSFCLA